MRSTAQGSFAAFLLLIPILAVPMLAVFGIPDFAPLVDSPLGSPDTAEFPRGDDAPPFNATTRLPDEEFPAVQRVAATELAAWPAQHVQPAVGETEQEQLARLRTLRQQQGVPHPAAPQPATTVPPVQFVSASSPSPFVPAETVEPAGAAAVAVETGTRPRSLDVVEPFPPHAPRPSATQPREFATAAQPLTWRGAVQRLNQMEIRNFRLEPGRTPDQFIFICSYTPRDNPRVSYRFEAEADEPLKAVEKVLAQIDSWLTSR
jgi:hypothetical protein